MSEEKKTVFTVKDIVFIGVFAAVTAVLAQVSIPTPWGIPITLQTFAVALTGYCMGKWKGTLSTFIYVLLGFIGVPVYAGLGAGPAKLFGLTGGFIWGFLFLAFACGLEDTIKKKWAAILFGILGLAVCHVCGLIQFALISGRTFGEAFLLATAPYLLKDVISVVAAFWLAIPIRKAMNMTGASVKRAAE